MRKIKHDFTKDCRDDYKYTEKDNEFSAKKRSFGYVKRSYANALYRAYKTGNVEVLPETIQLLYNEAHNDELKSRLMAQNDYCRYGDFYDTIHKLTCALINSDYENSQKIINHLEYDFISRSGKKSSFFKYKSMIKEEEE